NRVAERENLETRNSSSAKYRPRDDPDQESPERSTPVPGEVRPIGSIAGPSWPQRARGALGTAGATASVAGPWVGILAQKSVTRLPSQSKSKNRGAAEAAAGDSRTNPRR